MLLKESVEFVVAPYEADAQMAYLAITGQVHAVITEDSDMLPYGCPRVGFTFPHIFSYSLNYGSPLLFDGDVPFISRNLTAPRDRGKISRFNRAK